jgi:hypothetical protein
MNLSQHNSGYIRAFELAVKAHLHQRRKGDRTPYVSHLSHVVSILINAEHNDNHLLISALLHDVIEDTDVTAKQLETEFGTEVMETVLEVTDDKGLSLDERQCAQLRHAGSLSKNAKLIKLADGISNAALLPPNWTITKAEKSLAHVKSIAEKCADSCAMLYQILLETVELTLVQHGSFVAKKRLDLDRWLTDNCVYFSFKNDTFYYLKLNSNSGLSGAIITGKYDVCLRSLRQEKLTLLTENDVKIAVDMAIDENGLSAINQPFIAEFSPVRTL